MITIDSDRLSSADRSDELDESRCRWGQRAEQMGPALPADSGAPPSIRAARRWTPSRRGRVRHRHLRSQGEGSPHAAPRPLLGAVRGQILDLLIKGAVASTCPLTRRRAAPLRTPATVDFIRRLGARREDEYEFLSARVDCFPGIEDVEGVGNAVLARARLDQGEEIVAVLCGSKIRSDAGMVPSELAHHLCLRVGSQSRQAGQGQRARPCRPLTGGHAPDLHER
jgi:hypothetical protein